MDSAFREMLEGLQAALRAKDEHEDVRETVHRLEAFVLDLARKITPPPATPSS